MQNIKLQENDFKLGEAVPWPIYGKNGNLLLDQGQVVGSQKLIDGLLVRGVFRKASADEILKAEQAAKSAKFSLDSPFNVLDALRINLQRILTDISASVESDYNERLLKIAKVIQKLCFENSDAALGAIILDQKSAYTNIHPILCAILTELMTRRQNIPDEDRLLYIAAALTQNVGMLELQAELTNQTEKLTEEQSKSIKEHPLKSKEIMQGLGVVHEEWLNTILFHHERPDGKGYPSGLTRDEIPVYAKILSVTDIYSAMVLPRKYRDGFYVKKALQDIFLQRGKAVDEQIAQLLIKEIGIYPPGTFVKLANGETAIVLRRGTRNAASPLVLSIINISGQAIEKPIQRDTIHKDIYGIIEVVPRLEDLQINRDEIWNIGSK